MTEILIRKIFLQLLYVIAVANNKRTWNLTREYRGETFFDDWTFFTDIDPTNGFVDYVPKEQALNKRYTKILPNSSVYIGTDYQNIATDNGRESVRISTNTVFNYGIFIAQITHVPEGCGTWPAYWVLGGDGLGCDWPACGEMDILEACNQFTFNSVSLHTTEGCDFTGVTGINVTARTRSTNCYTSYPDHLGCTFELEEGSFGSAFNKLGGGVYAFQWTDHNLSVWFWNMKDVPANAQSMEPAPETWGTPSAFWPWGSWCRGSYLRDIRLILDLTFCGDWSGGVFYDGCAQTVNDTDCAHFVKNNPSYFEKAYWMIDYIRVFNSHVLEDKPSSSETNDHWIVLIVVVTCVIVIVSALGTYLWWRNKQNESSGMNAFYSAM
eukprot:52215_1